MESRKILLMNLFAGQEHMSLWTCVLVDLRTQQGKETVGQIERVALTYIPHHM